MWINGHDCSWVWMSELPSLLLVLAAVELFLMMVGTMLGKDSVRNRLQEGEQGLSLTEFV